VLCIFRSLYFFAIGLQVNYLALGEKLPPHFGLRSQATRLVDKKRTEGSSLPEGRKKKSEPPHSCTRRCATRLSRSLVPLSNGLARLGSRFSAVSQPRSVSKLQFCAAAWLTDFKVELSGVHSPLLTASKFLSFPGLNKMLQFSP